MSETPVYRSLRLGKVRRFDCKCGGRCIRPLDGPVKDCDRCGAELFYRPSTIEDLKISVKDMLSQKGVGNE